MKEFLKYLGVLIVILGVCVFIAYALVSHPTNTYLIACISVVVVASIALLFLTHMIQD